MLIASIVVKKKFATFNSSNFTRTVPPSVRPSIFFFPLLVHIKRQHIGHMSVRLLRPSVRLSVVFFWSIECMSDTCLSVHLSVLLLWSIECMSATCSGFYFCFDGNRWRSHPLCTTDDTMRGRKRRRRTGWHWEGVCMALSILASNLICSSPPEKEIQ